MKSIYFVLMSFVSISFACCETKDADYNLDKYLIEEKIFLDQLFKSGLLQKSYKYSDENLDSDLMEIDKVFNIYDSLFVFESLGVSLTHFKSLLKPAELVSFNLSLKSKKLDVKSELNSDINLIYTDSLRAGFQNFYYRLSRVSFNSDYSKALIAIELVCFDCGGLVLHKFTKDKNGNWKSEDILNVWIN